MSIEASLPVAACQRRTTVRYVERLECQDVKFKLGACWDRQPMHVDSVTWPRGRDAKHRPSGRIQNTQCSLASTAVQLADIPSLSREMSFYIQTREPNRPKSAEDGVLKICCIINMVCWKFTSLSSGKRIFKIC